MSKRGKRSAKPLSQRAYAEHRGCALSAVQKAIRDGRLDESLTTDGRGHAKIISAELADAEWQRNTRSGSWKGEARIILGPDGVEVYEGDVQRPDDEITYNEARRRREIELWRQAKVKRETDELELDARRGKLVLADEVEASILDDYTVVRTKLLGVPSRCRQRDPGLTRKQVSLFEDMIREALEELADGADG